MCLGEGRGIKCVVGDGAKSAVRAESASSAEAEHCGIALDERDSCVLVAGRFYYSGGAGTGNM